MRSRKNKMLMVLMPLTAAGKACGVKYDTLDKAVARGELPIRSVLLKPSGSYQPLVSSRDLMAWKIRMAKRYEKLDSQYHRAIVKRIELASLPVEQVSLEAVLNGIYGDQVGA